MSASLLIACPMAKEAEALNRCLRGSFEVVPTGLGIKRTVPALLKAFRERRPSLLLFSGSAGQLDLSLEMGDIVVPAAWCIQDGPCLDCDPSLLETLRGKGWEIAQRGLMLEQAVLKAQQRSALCQATGAAVYDTVTAAVLRVCLTSGVPCLTPKIVASTVRSGLLAFWSNLDRNIRPLAVCLERMAADLGLPM